MAFCTNVGVYNSKQCFKKLELKTPRVPWNFPHLLQCFAVKKAVFLRGCCLPRKVAQRLRSKRAKRERSARGYSCAGLRVAGSVRGPCRDKNDYAVLALMDDKPITKGLHSLSALRPPARPCARSFTSRPSLLPFPPRVQIPDSI